MGVRPPMSATISSIYSSASVMDCDCLDKWISSDLSVNLVSAFSSPFHCLMVECAGRAGIYTHFGSVLPHRSGRLSPFLTAVTQLQWGSFDLFIPPPPYFCITWGSFCDLFLIVGPSVCSAISNQL